MVKLFLAMNYNLYVSQKDFFFVLSLEKEQIRLTMDQRFDPIEE